MKGRVLIVDDDPAVLSALRRTFVLEDYEVLAAEDGETALDLTQTLPPDVIVLDIMLPGLDGLSVCQRIRARSSVPILMLTARDTVPDRVAGLDSGADDYLVKPFATDELLARVRALHRRANPSGQEQLQYADLTLDPHTREVFRAGVPLNLTPREFDLLEVLLHHPRLVLSREQLCQQVWGYAFEGESNFIDVAIKELRKKLEVNGLPRLVQTVRGYGYALRDE
jgi:two-component system, OmpR family, response regulator MprA